MNDRSESPTAAPVVVKRRRGLPWLIALALGLAAAALVWTSRPDRDPRLVGEWRSASGLVRRYHANGRFEFLTSPTAPPLEFGRPDLWRTENGKVVHFRQKPVTGRLTLWFQNLFNSRTGVLAVGISDEPYEILELTDTTLKIRRVRTPPAPPRPAEVFHRTLPGSL